jgi:small multidrug resistance family-3 protein
LIVIGGLFVLAGLCEIGGGYLIWGHVRQDKPLVWALAGAALLAFGRVYAAYGGFFIGLALIWGVVVEGFRPDKYDVLGALTAVFGVLVRVVPYRG